MEIDAWDVILGCTGIISTLTGIVWWGEVDHRKMHAAKLLEHSDRITRIEASAITKTDLREMEQRIMDALTGMDRHQTAAIARVEQVATRAHERADELRRDISGA